jgi:uncharacterized protein YceK
MRNILIITAVATALLSGCATVKYVPTAGATQPFYTAKYRCMQETQPQGEVGVQGSQNFVAATVGILATFAILKQQADFKACMAANGFVPQ